MSCFYFSKGNKKSNLFFCESLNSLALKKLKNNFVIFNIFVIGIKKVNYVNYEEITVTNKCLA